MQDGFSEKFLFGASTSSHQVEGGTENDWSVWEAQAAPRLASRARKNPPTGGWPEHILNPPAGGPNPLEEENYISGKACDHYNRYEEDFDIAKRLGHTAHRFSIEWSRIEPEEGRFDLEAIDHYRKVIRALRARGMEPFVTLWHFALPLWLSRRGGVLAADFPERFALYAKRVWEGLGEDVSFWVTINEPEIYAMNGYCKGVWPPGKKNVFSCLRALRHMVRAHRAAYRVLKRVSPEAYVGIAKHNVYFEADGGQAWNRFLKSVADRWWNRWFLDRIKDTQDFIGINYYFHNRIAGWFGKNEDHRTSDMGWELYPEGIKAVIEELKGYDKPLYITENGLADAEDKNRTRFIEESLAAVREAIKAGADVRGYFYWSLLDNFEWDKGFWPRFGLVEVNYRTRERKIRPSAWAYKRIIENANIKTQNGGLK